MKQFYGNNFQHTLKDYTKSEDGLALYGVHYSDYKKWGIAPDSNYFPVGVYFYYLSDNCQSAVGNGFATDRRWANVARIDNNKMVILKQGHARNFDKKNLKDSLSRLQKIHGSLPKSNPGGNKFSKIAEHNSAFAHLGNILSTMEAKGLGSFNKLLHIAGYDGIVDYDGWLLPIESCQGVQTWPGGAQLVESVPTPKKSPNAQERLSQMLIRLKHQTNGTLQLTRDEVGQIVQMLPKFYHRWDITDSKSDLYGWLLQKLDFGHKDALQWLKDRDWFGDRFYMELEKNPTTPKEYWEQLLGSPNHGAKLTAKDMLGECFSRERFQKLAGILVLK